MKKVLLILESDVTRELLTNALTEYEVQWCCGDDARHKLASFRPDALILDLFFPGTDGFSILESCQGMIPPAVIALSVLISDFVLMKAAQLGIGFVISKPCTIDYIAKRLEEMLHPSETEAPYVGDCVTRLLDQFGLRGKPRVLSALRMSIVLALRDPDSLLTKDIYPVVCEAYGASEGAVDQAIRRMIQKAWENRSANAGIWEEVFPGFTEYPSNGIFITEISRYLCKKYPFRFRKGS